MTDPGVQLVREWLQRQPFSLRTLTRRRESTIPAGESYLARGGQLDISTTSHAPDADHHQTRTSHTRQAA
jgi:hypothetical protein